jgi:hypothetical protein
MIRPATLPLAGGRYEPFVYTIALEAIDLTGATLAMQVRLTPDAPGVPLVDLVLADPPAQGLSFTVNNAGLIPVSTVKVRINETTMEGMPAASEVGLDTVLAYDLQVTRPGVHEKVRYFRGPFTVEAGVTQ